MSRPFKADQITDGQIIDAIRAWQDTTIMDLDCTALAETFKCHRSSMQKRIAKLSRLGIIEPINKRRRGAIKLVV